MNNTLQELKQKIVDLSLSAYRAGLFSGTSGNMSVRVPGGMLITPTSVRYDVMTKEQIIAMGLDGMFFPDSPENPSSEWRMHAAVYEAYPDCGAVFHTHSPYATAFAACRESIPPVLIEAMIFLGGEVRCAAYARPGTKEVGLNAVPALEGRGGCTLANHGVLAVGRDLDEAYLRAEYIEDVAKVASIARTVGTPVPLEML